MDQNIFVYIESEREVPSIEILAKLVNNLAHDTIEITASVFLVVLDTLYFPLLQAFHILDILETLGNG